MGIGRWPEGKAVPRCFGQNACREYSTLERADRWRKLGLAAVAAGCEQQCSTRRLEQFVINRHTLGAIDHALRSMKIL